MCWRVSRPGDSAGRVAPTSTSRRTGDAAGHERRQRQRDMQRPDVTLCCVDTREPARALWALQRWHGADPLRRGAAVLECIAAALAARRDPGSSTSASIPSRRIRSSCCADCRRMVHTSHLLVVQWDGFVRRPRRPGTTYFLAYDYIGPAVRFEDAAPAASAASRCARDAGCCRRCSTPTRRSRIRKMSRSAWSNRRVCSRAGPRRAHRAAGGGAGASLTSRVEPPAPTFGFHGLFNFPRELPAGESGRHRGLAAGSADEDSTPATIFAPC